MRSAYPALLLCFFVAWTSTLDAGEPYLVRDINPTGDGVRLNHPVSFKGEVYFLANDGTSAGLWKSDGTSPGTVKLTDVYGPAFGGTGNAPDTAGNTTVPLTVAGHQVFFSLVEPYQYFELWKTDGTPEGTERVRTFTPFSDVHDAYDLYANIPSTLGSTLFFAGYDELHGWEVWKSDGTEAGTARVTDINPNGDSLPRNFIDMDGFVYFQADDDPTDAIQALWRTDGTPEGTTLIKRLRMPYERYNTGGDLKRYAAVVELEWGTPTLFFAAYDDTGAGLELWRSDGTSHGTLIVKQLNTTDNPVPSHASDVEQLTPMTAPPPSPDSAPLGEILYFAATDYSEDNGSLVSHGQELWRSDGTAPGTSRVKDLDGGEWSFAGSFPTGLTVVGERLFFRATTHEHGSLAMLYMSDGTADGTVLVPHDFSGNGLYDPRHLVAAHGRLYFKSRGPDHPERRLYVTDGTAQGTRLIRPNLNPGNTTSRSEPMIVNGNRLFFSAEDQQGTLGSELYAIAGKPSKLGNIATRGRVGMGDDVMIAGFIIDGGSRRVIIRASGPSMAALGVSNVLNDPLLQIFSGQAQIASNDDWRDTQEAEILNEGMQPSDDSESAIIIELDPGPYTAIVSGVGGTTGNALVEVFDLD